MKEKKVLKSDNSDRIGSLPDALLHHILSSLDMKEVVQTSLLSSRWRYVWTSLPIINCNQSLWKKENHDKQFTDFVDQVLLLRDGSNIKKLQICCPNYYYFERICVWLTSAVRKHLQEMHLQFCPDRLKELPQVVFSPGITVLELNLAPFDPSVDDIKIPNLICSMTRLTTLIWMDVQLPDGNSSGELLFSYPVLENLTMIECWHAHLEAFSICTPRLKTIVIQNKSCVWDENYRIRNLSVLVSARICCGFIREKSMIQLLEDISCAKTIDLSCEWLFEGLELSSAELTSLFSNLRCLKLIIADITGISFSLKKFSCLETFVFRVSFFFLLRKL